MAGVAKVIKLLNFAKAAQSHVAPAAAVRQSVGCPHALERLEIRAFFLDEPFLVGQIPIVRCLARVERGAIVSLPWLPPRHRLLRARSSHSTDLLLACSLQIPRQVFQVCTVVTVHYALFIRADDVEICWLLDDLVLQVSD